MQQKINKDITKDDYYIYNKNIIIKKGIQLPSAERQYALVFDKGIDFDFYNDDINIDKYQNKYKIISFNPNPTQNKK